MKLQAITYSEDSTCTMTVSATNDELMTAATEAYERTRCNYTIKGFARGEADRAQIEEARGANVFWYDAINDLIDRDMPAILDDVVAKEAVLPVSDVLYALDDMKAGEGFTVQASFCILPEVTISQYSGFAVRVQPEAVTDAEVEAALQEKYDRSARYISKEGFAELGDFVYIDYSGYANGAPFEGGSALNRRAEVGNNVLLPGFEAEIIKHKAGESFEFKTSFPADYRASSVAGKDVVYKTTLRDICVKELLPFDDSFAKEIGGVDTLDAYRDALRAELAQAKANTAYGRTKGAAMNSLSNATEITVPELLIMEGYHQEMHRMEEMIHGNGMTMEGYLGQSHQTKEILVERLRKGVAEMVKVQLALVKVAQLENLFPTEEQIDAEIAAIAAKYQQTVEEVESKTNRHMMRVGMARAMASEFVTAQTV